jgi:hypothetical protein
MVISVFDLLLVPIPIYLLIIYFISTFYQQKKEIHDPHYKWYTKGLFAKIGGAIALCLVYQLYYPGGDTTNYFISSSAISRMAFKDFDVYLKIMLGDHSQETYSVFDITTGWPIFQWSDEKAIFVSRLIVPFMLLSFHTFIVSAILLSWVCYSGIWRLFLLFQQQFPQLERQLAISTLFIPSVVFWGSGLLKDTITLSAVGWYSYHFFLFFIQKKYKVSSALCILFSSMLLIGIKPYIFFALVPGSIIWLSNERLVHVKSKVLRAVAAPVFIATGIGLGVLILGQMSDTLGVYAIDKVLDKAVESNMDQKSSYYGGNSFDIGDFDASFSGVMSKAHLAITAALYRPFLWEAKNPVMFLSGLENTYILLLSLMLMFKLKITNFFLLIGQNPLLLFSMLFALFFAFSVGLATSNFGSLVRLKIPCIPFFVSSLFVLKHLYEKKYNKKLGM